MTETTDNENAAAGTETKVPAMPPKVVKPTPPRRLLCLKEVEVLVGIAKATIYRRLKKKRETGENTFPSPVQITDHRIGWHAAEIEAWIASRPAKF